MREAIRKMIIENLDKPINRAILENIKRDYCKKFSLKTILNSEILQEYRALLENKSILRSLPWESVLKKRSIRTMSGIAPVAVLTKSYPCPGNCAYCPHQKDVPVSYLSNEPAVMRAIRCGYNPYKQVISRLKALENNGHEPTKIEIIVIGGTWSYLPKKYKYWYILNCFKAVNDYSHLRDNKLILDKKEKFYQNSLKTPYKLSTKLIDLQNSLKTEQEKNEKAAYRIIGLTLETRPDYINDKELLEMRDLGCTRVEIGVQAIDDEILKINKRGHGVEVIVNATKALKQYGFKVTYHFMPALPGSSPKKDLAMFQQLFAGEKFQPDQIKFYPTVVTKGSLLYTWHKQGKYKPYTDQELKKLIIDCKKIVPEYVRIIRLIRDIPGESIIAGNKITNLRQIIKQENVVCRCIRCREIKDGKIISPKIKTIKYEASGGTEYFISANSADDLSLYGFCRLRLDNESAVAPAIIRELHVYGELVSIGSTKKVQHQGLGGKLLQEAERIVKSSKIKKMAVISGVGVRGYYRKKGYKKRDSYMFKNL